MRSRRRSRRELARRSCAHDRDRTRARLVERAARRASTTRASRASGMAFPRCASTSRATTSARIDWNVTARMNDAVRQAVHRGARDDGDAARRHLGARALRLARRSRSASWPPSSPRCSRSRAIQQQRPRRPDPRSPTGSSSFVPPKKGTRHVLRVIREILAFEPVGRGTDLAAALDFLGTRREARRRSCS